MKSGKAMENLLVPPRNHNFQPFPSKNGKIEQEEKRPLHHGFVRTQQKKEKNKKLQNILHHGFDLTNKKSKTLEKSFHNTKHVFLPVSYLRID